ncbi:ADP-ribosyltransferase [[Mycobacterium] vasticus]|uniref:ADP-ribosyltransferase n=1 Tax=[Mycobacterium] vasticus TaxID=2875777 RepID=A0ABU5YS79_9MYCO|nr:ADP-ribosyltransferase [Mycolicibacter sp. MYC017]MEB3067967.1 ADP-ribosyltransferase [Mycolicibacter sp. MYC017]
MEESRRGHTGPDQQWLTTSRAHVGALTGRYRQSLVDYTGSGHLRINQWLRRGQQPADLWVAAQVRDIDVVLSANPLARDTELIRTIDMREAFHIVRGEDLVKIAHKDRVERGFLSTTRFAAGGRVKESARPVRLTLFVPLGTPAAAIEDISKFPDQGEVLLGRGLWYVLRDPAYARTIGVWTATLEILP